MSRLHIDAQQRERGYVAFRRSIQAGLSHDKHPGQRPQYGESGAMHRLRWMVSEAYSKFKLMWA